MTLSCSSVVAACVLDDQDHEEGQKETKTYNRRDSQMVTHSSTSRPVQCLCMAERTGCPVLTDLWSCVLEILVWPYIIAALEIC
jgi:hypothetical protein